MGFFDLLSNISLLNELYEHICKKLSSEQETFGKQIKKCISIACNEFKIGLQLSKELSNCIPDNADALIFDQVMKKLHNNIPFTEDDVLCNEDLPEHVRKALSLTVLRCLHSSLDFSMRDYIAWAKLSYQEMHKQLQYIQQFIQIMIFDSAKINNVSSHSRSRYHYSYGTVRLVGRKEEMNRLKAFCGYDNKMKALDEQKKPFLWWAITGEGGIGKSRIGLELSYLVEKQGWSVCVPAEHTRQRLDACSSNLLCNTLFILDYSEYDTVTISRWMVTLNAEKYRNILIRVLLIQRLGYEIKDIWPIQENAAISELIKESIFDDQYKKDNKREHVDLLRLQPLTKSDICNIEMDFASSKRNLTNGEAQKIYDHLKRIDNRLLRPLFAMLLTDAYLDNPEEVFQWDREKILDHIYQKEVDMIRSSIKRHCSLSPKVDLLCELGLTIQVMATIIGGLNLQIDGKHLLSDEMYILEQMSQIEKRHFFAVPALFKDVNKKYCAPLTPDILGEWFVLSFLKETNSFSDYIPAAWENKPYEINRFLNRLYQDFKDHFIPFQHFLGEITIPDTATNLRNFSFPTCKYLSKIVLPKGITKIDDNTFRDCTTVKEIILPDTVKKIGKNSFRGCSSLKEIVIPNGVSIIEEYAFQGCESLERINIPKSVRKIERWAFGDCYTLIEINIPNSVTKIGEWAFGYCSSLLKIKIPESIQTIENGVFEGCEVLKEISLPNTIKQIERWAFAYCLSLDKVKLPNSLTLIGERAFECCKSLVSITIPSSVIRIDARAFLNCNEIINILFMGSNALICEDVFYGCTNLNISEVMNCGDCVDKLPEKITKTSIDNS